MYIPRALNEMQSPPSSNRYGSPDHIFIWDFDCGKSSISTLFGPDPAPYPRPQKSIHHWAQPYSGILTCFPCKLSIAQLFWHRRTYCTLTFPSPSKYSECICLSNLLERPSANAVADFRAPRLTPRVNDFLNREIYLWWTTDRFIMFHLGEWLELLIATMSWDIGKTSIPRTFREIDSSLTKQNHQFLESFLSHVHLTPAPSNFD